MRTIRGGEPRSSTSTFTQLLSAAPLKPSMAMLFYVHRDHKDYFRDGKTRTVTSTFTLLLSSVELSPVLRSPSQASGHFRCSETQATCDGCFAYQSVYAIIYHDAGMSETVHPVVSSKVDVKHRHMPVLVPILLTDTLVLLLCSADVFLLMS